MKKKKINLGVITYQNVSPRNASSNIGDYIQTLSVLNLYKKLVERHNQRKRPYSMKTFIKHAIEGKVKNFNFVFLKRDNISDPNMHKNYENIITIFHGWWMHFGAGGRNFDFNIPENIKPVFLSFHIAKEALYKEENLIKLKKAEPIGCRDLTTLTNLKKRGVKAYFSGCTTSTIDFFEWENKNNLQVAVDSPARAPFKNMGHEHKKWKNLDYKLALFEALDKLKFYSECKSIRTSRLHCYIPCLAMGVPVKLVAPRTNEKYNRFDGFQQMPGRMNDLKKMRKNIEKKFFEIVKLF